MFMKTYEETTRSIMERAETQIQKNKKRNRVIRTVAACVIISVLSAAGGIGVSALIQKNDFVAEEIEQATAEHLKTPDESDPVESANSSQIPTYYDENAPKTATITVEGKEYTGEYVMTIKQIDILETPGDIREYLVSGEDGEWSAVFYIDATTGELFVFHRKTDADRKPIDRVKQTSRAKLYAAHYLGDDVNKYTAEIDWSEYKLYYNAYRMIDGLKTAECFCFTFDSDGKLESLKKMYLGSFSGMDSLPYDLGKYESAAAKIIKQKSREIPNLTYYEYVSRTPVVLPDGRVGIVYEVSFHHLPTGYIRHSFLVTPDD